MNRRCLYALLPIILVAVSCANAPKLPPEQVRNADYGPRPIEAEVLIAEREFAIKADKEFNSSFLRQKAEVYRPHQGYIGLKTKDGGWHYEFGYLVNIYYRDPPGEHKLLMKNGKMIYYHPFLSKWYPSN